MPEDLLVEPDAAGAVADCFDRPSTAVVGVVTASSAATVGVLAEATGIWLITTAPPATLATPATVTTARERQVRRHRFFMAEVMPGRAGRGFMPPTLSGHG